MPKQNQDPIFDQWVKKAESVLLGRWITKVRYMDDEEQEATGFYHKALVIQLDDGTILFPSADDEGNDAGALYYQKKGDDNYVLPVI